MKLPIIKQLVETYTLEELAQAELAISEGETPAIEIIGEDEGEQLTHAYASAFIRRLIDEKGMNFQTAMREYTKMVRETLN
jgi:uncharacterized protein YajQ (UPF0234 family)